MNWLVAIAVVAVAAAAFVFSYDGVHAIALIGGVSPQLARYYPGLFDGVLVIACVAAIVLRDGRWWARLWAWAVIIVLLGAIGVTDVLHAMNYTLRHRLTEGLVAAAPVVAVLLAFSLLLTLLRQSRTHAEEPTAPSEIPALPAAISGPPMALPAAPAAWDETVPMHRDDPLPGTAPTREEPALADTQEIPPAAAPAEAVTGEAPPAEPPTVDHPAPPTVLIPAVPSEPPPGPASTRGSQGIRYAGADVPGMAGKKRPTADLDDAPFDEDDWDREDNGPLAGLVYPARDDHADSGDDAAEDVGETSDVNETNADAPAPAQAAPEVDHDAPPFATAPFTSMPRLNRVRSTPTPPEDEEE